MANRQHETSWKERTGRASTAPDGSASPTDDIDRVIKCQAFHHANSSLGIIGHWVGLAGTMAPTIIGEFVTDPARRWRAVRLAAVGTAVAYEALYTARELQRRHEQAAKLAECRSRDP